MDVQVDNSPMTIASVSSPFLKHPNSNSKEHAASEANYRRRSLERAELLNIPEGGPSNVLRNPVNTTSRQNRFSREILGLNDAVVTAPDSAPQPKLSESRSSDGDHSQALQRAEDSDEDANSVIFGGSVASTIPDRYGFTGGVQYSQTSDKY